MKLGAGVVASVFGVSSLLILVDLVLFKTFSGDWRSYYGIVLYATSTFGCAVAARRCFSRRSRSESTP